MKTPKAALGPWTPANKGLLRMTLLRTVGENRSQKFGAPPLSQILDPPLHDDKISGICYEYARYKLGANQIAINEYIFRTVKRGTRSKRFSKKWGPYDRIWARYLSDITLPM